MDMHPYSKAAREIFESSLTQKENPAALVALAVYHLQDMWLY